MRTPWLAPLLVVLVVVAVLAVVVFLGEQERRPPVTSEVEQTARLLNECLRMYVADFEAFPPTTDTRQVTALLLPYVALRLRERVPGGREAPRVRVEFLYRPGAPRGVIADRATFRMGRFSRSGETLVADADGHVAPPGR